MIVLINPSYDYPVLRKRGFAFYNKIWPPLDLANCAAMLEKENFDVKIIDANAERFTPKKVAKKVEDADKIFITSSSLDRWQCPHPDLTFVLECIKEMRKRSDAKIYLMGAHGTIRPKEMLEISKADGIVIGEPELTVAEICKNGLEKAEGVCYKKKNRIIVKPRKNWLDLNTLPLPALHLLPMKKYFYEFLGKNFSLFETSRGCPFNCIFCFKKMYGPLYRKKSAENVIRELKFAMEEFGVKNACFIDLEFAINRNCVEKMCDFLIKGNYDFKWACQTRVDTIDLDLLKKMKKAGCALIYVGVESGSERILELINKKVTIEQIKKAVLKIKKVGIDLCCFFIIGLPTEKIEDMKKTIEFAKMLNPTYASFHIAVPYPGTVFYEMIKSELEDELFPTIYDGLYSEDELKKVIRDAYLSFYLRPKFIVSRILKGKYKLLFNQLRLFLGYVR